MKAVFRTMCRVVPMLLGIGAALSFAQGSGKNFLIFDNMAYKQKPNAAQYGLIASNVIYENKIWPSRQLVGTLPDRKAFAELVRAESSNPGPLVIDIENLSLRGSPQFARGSAETLEKLADWAHEAVPGKVIGYYGTNTFFDLPAANLDIAHELAGHVDAFFVPLYTFDDDRSRWEKRAQTTQAQARELDPKKPLYFYLWPQYHVGSVKALRYVAGDYWKFELETVRRYGDGIVLWGSGTYVWNPKSGWWNATQEFAVSLQQQKESHP